MRIVILHRDVFEFEIENGLDLWIEFQIGNGFGSRRSCNFACST